MGIQPQDWRAELLEDERLESDYQRALKDGDTGRAQALARTIGERREHGRREGARTLAAITSRQPRPPAKGEEARLNRSLERIGRESAKREKRKAAVLAEAADNPSDAVFARLQALDRELQNLGYQKSGIHARLDEIERHHQAVEAARRQQEESAQRQKAERERGRKVERLNALAKETGAEWKKIVASLSTIKRLAQELDESPDRWLQSILEAAGGVETIAPVSGIGPGAWLFPNPLEGGH
jgi:hypothetical protein